MKVNANHKWPRLIMLVLNIMITCYLFSDFTKLPIFQKYILRFSSISLIIISLYQLIFSIVLSEDGVYQYCYKQCIRHLPWSDVGQICEAKDFPISAKVSGSSYLLIVPKTRNKYNKRDTIGVFYCMQNYRYIFRIDNSQCNRQFIEIYFGKISNER